MSMGMGAVVEVVPPAGPALYDVVEDFDGVDLGDARLDRRLHFIAREIAQSPSLPLPAVFRDPGQLEGAYRLIENERVEPESILAPHIRATIARAATHRSVLVLHDTTTFTFGGGQKDGMGVIDPTSNPGFYLHQSLCVSTTGEPLGAARVFAWQRTKKVSGKIPQSISQYLPDRESLRWIEAVTEIDDQLRHETPDGIPVHAIHVMDREGDFAELLAELDAGEISFVIRAKNDRRLVPGRNPTDDKLFAAVDSSPLLLKTSVPIVRRHTTKRGRAAPNPSRQGGRVREASVTWAEMRDADLEVRAVRRTIYGGNGHHAHFPDAGITLNIVSIQEVNPPDGMEPVSWYLLTDQPIDTVEDVVRVVNIYRLRWLIEEYFKALKTGCGYEKHQFESADRYLRMLAIYIPIAVQLLRARWYDRFRPNDLATVILSAEQIETLRAHLWRKEKTLSPNPTVGEVMKVIAQLGGHLPSNGPPGWLVLQRGFATLSDLTAGYLAARDWMERGPPLPTCDDSLAGDT